MTTVTAPDFDAIKTRQQGTWSSGDYAVIGTTLQIVGETLCEAVDIAAGEEVLDVAAGNGNASLAAARRGASVTASDYVPALLDGTRNRAAAEGLTIDTEVADAEAMPFADASFDAVLSTFGVMFTPNQEQSASELLRVCRPGGRIGLTNWTPDGFIGHMFKIVGTVRRAAGRHPLAARVGHRSATHRAARRPCRQAPAAPQGVRLPLSLGRGLGRHLPRVLRPDAQGVRRTRCGSAVGTRAGLADARP